MRTPPDEERVVARRPLRADRRRAAWMLAGFVVVVLVSIWLARSTTDDSGVGPTPLHFLLIALNLLLLFALVVSVARYLIRLLSETRAGILGSRFRLKLVTSIIGLCLVPAVVLNVGAVFVLYRAVDQVLGPEVDQMVEIAQRQVNQFLEAEETDLAADVRELSEGLARSVLVTPERRDELRAWLEAELPARSLAAARVYFRGRAEAVEILTPALSSRGLGSPLDPKDLVPGEFEGELAALLSGGRYAPRRWQREGELFVVAGEAILPPGHDRPAGALFVARIAPAEVRENATALNELRQEYNRLRAQAPYLKAQQALLFTGFVLFTLLGATWVGLYIARGITVPIQRLAGGTAQIRRGNLEHRVSWEGSDELATLVEDFNAMARELGTQAREVEGKTAELEHANRELEHRRDEMAQLLENLTAGVLAVDGRGRVTMVNRAARQALQLDAQARAGVELSELLGGERLEPLREEIASVLGREGLRRAREIQLLTARGPSHLQVVLTDQPAAEPEEPTGVLVLIEDVTELVRAQKLATWREVARRIAHEIKNPLTPIQLAAQRILKKYRSRAADLDEALESGVETIVSEVSGLKQMVNEFSNFARMPEMRSVRGDLNVLVDSVAELYRGHERLTLVLELDPDLPPLPFDPELIRRALVNLVDNAVEATGGEGRVRLSTSRDPEGRVARVEVEDDGPGVPAADREKLFLPYFTTKPHGTGLGLAIVNRILADHGGRVGVGEAEGRGARFVLELPLGPSLGSAGEERPAASARDTGGRS